MWTKKIKKIIEIKVAEFSATVGSKNSLIEND
jgi:hypothetical protein